MNTINEEQLRARFAAFTPVAPSAELATRSIRIVRRRRNVRRILGVAGVALVVLALVLVALRWPLRSVTGVPDPRGESPASERPSASSTVPSPTATPTPASARTITFEGIPPARIGATIAQAQREGWVVANPVFGCDGTVESDTFLAEYPGVYPDWGPAGPLRGIMVKDDGYFTEAGAHVGMTLAELRASHGRQLQDLPRSAANFDSVADEEAGPQYGASIPVLRDGDRYLAFPILRDARNHEPGTRTGLVHAIWIGTVTAEGRLIVPKGC